MKVKVSAVVEHNGRFLNCYDNKNGKLKFPKWEYDDKKISNYSNCDSVEALEKECGIIGGKSGEHEQRDEYYKKVNFRKSLLKEKFKQVFQAEIEVLDPIMYDFIKEDDKRVLVIYYYCTLNSIFSDVKSEQKISWYDREQCKNKADQYLYDEDAKIAKHGFAQEHCAAKFWDVKDFENLDQKVPFIKKCCEYVDYTLNLYVNYKNVDSWSSCWNFLFNPKNRFVQRILGRRFALIFEYLLPEINKRPDVIILAKNKVIILEFKDEKKISSEDIQQMKEYEDRIAHFHSKTLENNMEVSAFLVSTKEGYKLAPEIEPNDQLKILDKENFEEVIEPILSDALPIREKEEVDSWIDSDQICLKSFVEITKRIFETGDIPNIKSDRFEAINRTVNQVKDIIEKKERKKIIFVSGVPGSGKTLVGLRILYEMLNYEQGRTPIYISGNAALVNILEETLSDTSKEAATLIKHIKTYLGNLEKEDPPTNNVIIYDEAQRAQNRDDGLQQKQLLDIGNKIANQYSDITILCLVGKGQVIYKNETPKLEAWTDVLERYKDWRVYYPEDCIGIFTDCTGAQTSWLSLNYSIRSGFVNIAPWVEAVLYPNLKTATRFLKNIENQIRFGIPYNIWLITKKKDIRKIRDLINQEFPDDHIGFLYSSHSKKKIKQHKLLWKSCSAYLGLEESCKWYNHYSKNLTKGATEFIVQGIETEWPIVGFMGDLRIDTFDGPYNWIISDEANNLDDFNEPLDLLKSVYRVLLTRSRKGMFIYVPEELPEMRLTADFFRKMGIKEWSEREWHRQLRK